LDISVPDTSPGGSLRRYSATSPIIGFMAPPPLFRNQYVVLAHHLVMVSN